MCSNSLGFRMFCVLLAGGHRRLICRTGGSENILLLCFIVQCDNGFRMEQRAPCNSGAAQKKRHRVVAFGMRVGPLQSRVWSKSSG